MVDLMASGASGANNEDGQRGNEEARPRAGQDERSDDGQAQAPSNTAAHQRGGAH